MSIQSNNKKFGLKFIANVVAFFMIASSFVFVPAQPKAYAATEFGNLNFEQPLGDGMNGTWSNGEPQKTYAKYDITTAEKHSGSSSLRLQAYYKAGSPPDYESTYTWQAVDASAGDYVSVSGWAKSTVGSGDAGAFVQIKFENASGQNLCGGPGYCVQTPKITSGTYTNWKAFPVISYTAPEGTARVVIVLKTDGVSGGSPSYGTTYFDDFIVNVTRNGLSVTASKQRVSVGDAVGVNGTFTNGSGAPLNDVFVHIDMPSGFDFADKTVRVNGKQAMSQTLGDMPNDTTYTSSIVLLVTSGVRIGHRYKIPVWVEDAVGNVLGRAYIYFDIEADPVFDKGTIIGKVFNDFNENTVQDCGEMGVPFVSLYTEEGIGIVTDEYGRYHLPNVNPGRHIVKIDGHSLPEGTKFVTEEAKLVKTTRGMIQKANFAILLPPSGIPEEFAQDLQVMVTQGVDVFQPTLDVSINQDVLKLGVGVFEKEPVFTFDNNYGKYIKKWSLEIRDSFGELVWIGYGVGQPPAEVSWAGTAENGMLVTPGIYSYQLKVRDEQYNEDWTTLKFFEVMTKNDPKASGNYHPEIPSIGDFNLFKDGKRSISLNAKPVVRVQGTTKLGNQITINDTPVMVEEESGMFQKEFFVTPGTHDIKISTTNQDGETTSFTKSVTVKDSSLFMVALAEQQFGLNHNHGSMEAVEGDEFRNGFRQDGRVAFFLKGKIKGKFLIKAKYDTEGEDENYFTNLNPNDYYPIYGDNSTRDYETLSTTQKLYILVEMDKAYVKWGSYETEFTDTELASHNRTLSGLKINYDSVETTVYGDSKRGFKLYSAESETLSDHNELYATGGSLFYTRNRRIAMGSEKIRVEVRDKIQNMTIASYDLQASTDYEINYEEGRILLSRPLSSVAAADTLISNDILDGAPVYLIVDYEYEPAGQAYKALTNQGLRGYVWMGDHIRVGGTAIQEKRADADYQLRGVDALFKIGRNTKITAEYAQSLSHLSGSSVSYDGGITYADIRYADASGNRQNYYNGGAIPKDPDTLQHAYLIRGASQPIRDLELSGYLQGVENGFSSNFNIGQEGTQKYGVSARYKFTDNFSMRYRFDREDVIETLLSGGNGVYAPYQNRGVHTAQAVYDNGKYLAALEYAKTNAYDGQESQYLLPTIDNQISFDNGLAAKLGYHINDKLLPYIKAQTVYESKSNHQFGAGVRYQVLNDLYAYIEQMYGNYGDSTYFGFERQHKNGVRSYANIRSIDRGIGDKVIGTAIGNSFSLTQNSRVYSERQYSSYTGKDAYADILGYEGKAGDNWDYGAKFERRRLNYKGDWILSQAAAESLARANTFNTLGGNLGYARGKKFRARTYWEIRHDKESPSLAQIVTRNSVKYQFNEEWSWLSYMNYGVSDQYGEASDSAKFLEWNTGFAYRPIYCDKLNMLGRYTYTRDFAPEQQWKSSYYNGYGTDESAHILSFDIAYDISKYFGLAQKFAFKQSRLFTSYGDTVAANTFLTATRVNFHVTRKWDFAVEYRILGQSYAQETLRQGVVVELDREIYEYVRLGIGYNFTDFSDDLRYDQGDVRTTDNLRSNGFFVRMTGKF